MAGTTNVIHYRDFEYTVNKLKNVITTDRSKLAKVYGPAILAIVTGLGQCQISFSKDGLNDDKCIDDISKSVEWADTIDLRDKFKQGTGRIDVASFFEKPRTAYIFVGWCSTVYPLSLKDRIIDFFLYKIAKTPVAYLKEVELAGVFGEIYAMLHCVNTVDINCIRYLVWNGNPVPHTAQLNLSPEVNSLQNKYTKLEFFKLYFRWRAMRSVIHPKYRKVLDRLVNSDAMVEAAKRIGLDVVANNVIKYLEED